MDVAPKPNEKEINKKASVLLFVLQIFYPLLLLTGHEHRWLQMH